MTRPIEQHMRVTVCRWCGALAEECGGTCVSATPEKREFPMKVKASEVWKWPEWQAFAARLGIPLTRHVTDCTVHLNRKDVARVTLGFIPWWNTCQQHQSGTAHQDSDSSTERTDHHQPSEDTTDTGAS